MAPIEQRVATISSLIAPIESRVTTISPSISERSDIRGSDRAAGGDDLAVDI
jgi:hypothetical protein